MILILVKPSPPHPSDPLLILLTSCSSFSSPPHPPQSLLILLILISFFIHPMILILVKQALSVLLIPSSSF
jgi:hypothetical protein